MLLRAVINAPLSPACVICADDATQLTNGCIIAVSALPQGAVLYWSCSVQVSGAAPRADACECLLVRRIEDEDERLPHPLPTVRASAHAAFATAADAARRVRPAIELCARATLGKGITHVSVNDVESEHLAATSKGTDKCSTETSHSRKSVARMLRLLSAPVQAQGTTTAAGQSRGEMQERSPHVEADAHEDATRVTVGGVASLLPRKMTPANRLSGRFGILTALARAGAPHKKARFGSGPL